MPMISLGDLAQSFAMRRQSADLKASISTLSKEVTTGLVKDPARHLSGDVGMLNAIESKLVHLDGYQRAASDMALSAEAMQTVLQNVQALSSDLLPSLLSVASTGNSGSMAIVAREASQTFDAVVGMYNTRLGGIALFSGDQTATTALAPADQIMQQMVTLASGALSVQDVEAALDTWFASPTGFQATAYQGGAAPSPVRIGPNMEAGIGVTAADPAVRETLKALGMAALIRNGVFSGDEALQAELLKRAGEVLANGQNSHALLAGQLGTTEGQVEKAKARNTAEQSSLQIARLGLVAKDPYDASTELQAAQNQLETLYAITARLSRLNLMDFLR